MTRVSKDKHRLRKAQRMRLRLAASSPSGCATSANTTDEDDSAFETHEVCARATVQHASRVGRATGCTEKRTHKIRKQQRSEKQCAQDAPGTWQGSSEDACTDTSRSPQAGRPEALTRSASMQAMLLQLKEEFQENTRMCDSWISDIDCTRELFTGLH